MPVFIPKRKMKTRKIKKIELILLGMVLLLLLTIILNISIVLNLNLVRTTIIKGYKKNRSMKNQREHAYSKEAHFDLFEQQRFHKSSSSTSNHHMKSMVSRNVSKPKLLRQAVDVVPRTICASPEKNVPWILDGTCMEDPHYSFISSTPGYKHTCGFCGNDAE